MNQNYRMLFDFNPEIIYLNHAATGMLPKRSALAMTKHIEGLVSTGEHSYEGLLAIQSQFRQLASRLVNVTPDEMVFIRNTTDGITLALHSIDWRAGDNMIIQGDAFPASLYVAAYCFPGVEKRYVPLNHGSDFYDRLYREIDEHTRAIVVDYVHFLSGYRLNLKQLSNLIKNQSMYLIVDGIQGLGAVEVDLKDTAVDFFVAGGVKWLQGPSGTGLAYIRQQIIDDLIPFHVGWASAEYDDLSHLYPVRPLIKNARRFQPINDNYIGMIGLTESLRLVHEIGMKTIANKIEYLTHQVISTLKKHDYRVLTPEENKFRAGIVSFKHDRIESEKLYKTLQQNQIVCSLREGWIRLSLHFYNTEQEFDQVFSVIQSAVKCDN